jgi:nucleotide-binding universal stress UspA family protein
MRTYLVVVDETREAETALRFAARRAAKTNGAVHILALVPPTEFVQWGGVQATIEEEARQRAEALVTSAAGTLTNELAGIRPIITVRQGEAVPIVRRVLEETEHVAALVLGAAATGSPGPLVAHFAGAGAGQLPCPVMIIPGSLSNEAIDRLS